MMTFLSDWAFWREVGSFGYSILFCLIGVGCALSSLAFLVAVVFLLVDWLRKERHEN